jgi:hypothetical protein
MYPIVGDQTQAQRPTTTTQPSKVATIVKKGVTDREVQLIQIVLPNAGESTFSQRVPAESTNKHDKVPNSVTCTHARHEFIA